MKNDHYKDSKVVEMSKKFICVLAGPYTGNEKPCPDFPNVTCKDVNDSEYDVRTKYFTTDVIWAPQHIFLYPDGKEMFIVYHSHADPQKPSGDRVVNIDRLYFDEDGRLKIKGPTRSPQPMPSGCK